MLKLHKDELDIDKFRALVGSGIFTVKFIKGDGSLRVMNARLGVSKYVKGTAPEVTEKRNETLKATNKVGVFEMKGTSDRTEAENYRTINLNTVQEIKAGGRIYIVT